MITITGMGPLIYLRSYYSCIGLGQKLLSSTSYSSLSNTGCSRADIYIHSKPGDAAQSNNSW